MRRLLKNEMRRAFCNRVMIVIIIFECVLAVSHFIIYGIRPLDSMDVLMAATKDPYREPYSVFCMWMGANAYNLPGFIQAMLLPLLAVMPYGASYYDDVKSGFIKNVYLRTERLPYLKVKYCSAFLSGCTVAAIPLCLNFMLMLMIYPALMPQLASSNYPIFATDMWHELFYTHPFFYVLGFLLINMVFGGLAATLGLALSFLTDYKYIVLMTPFLLQMFFYALGNLTGVESISPVYYLQAGSGMASGSVIIVELTVLLTVGIVIFFRKGRKDDVY